MFSLDNTMRYWLYNKPVNMRMGFNGLSGIVNNSMGMRMPFSGEPDEIASSFGHADLISATRSALESPYVRRMKLLSKSL